MTFIGADDVAPSRWKNGGGVTRELLCIPLAGGAADEWLLRVSVADIEADGPFSAFDGSARFFAVLSGNGVDLSWATDDPSLRRRMTPQSPPLAFDGSDAPDCRLVDGPTRDLNVMVRIGAATVEMGRAVLDSASTWHGDGFGLFTLRPLVLEQGGKRETLPAFALAWQDGPDAAAWSLSAPSDDDATMGQTGVGPPPAYWIGLRRHASSSTSPA